MNLVDIVMMLSFTGVAFTVGYCLRGLFIDDARNDWTALDSHSDRYEPPCRNERI